MKSVRLNVRGAAFLVLAVLLNRVKHTHMADNQVEIPKKEVTKNDDNLINIDDWLLPCPLNRLCQDLNYPCITCDLNSTCVYGEELNVTCKARSEVNCWGNREISFQRTMICRYCYQTEPWEHSCTLQANCKSVHTPREYYRTNCSVLDDVICLGRRHFPKRVVCNWTGGYRWSTALALSITLGGFGADRFYLGHWQEGIGKLFSFGGLGVWTLIDVILISLHYLGPADGSLYL